jgi:NAD(P)-dependent dehydrogenase (short-subunit alcohol dehydrogenase family)
MTGKARTVLITGASSGIGRACARRLAGAGFQVWAGVRSEADTSALRAEDPAITPVRIDVTDAASIAEAARQVAGRLGDAGLGGLVNNAGIGLSAPIEYVSAEVLKHHFEVNVFGQLAVTQAFLPLLRKARGRIVNMGSVGGRMTIPFGGVLCATKSALGAINDALRLELRPFGIRVCLIEPASIYTPAAEKTLGDVEATIRGLPVEGAARYGQMLREFNRRAYAFERKGSPADVVARVVEHALTAARPRVHYPVGKHARILAAMPRLFPDWLLDRIRRRLFGMPRMVPAPGA